MFQTEFDYQKEKNKLEPTLSYHQSIHHSTGPTFVMVWMNTVLRKHRHYTLCQGSRPSRECGAVWIGQCPVVW